MSESKKWNLIDRVITAAPAVLLYGPPGTGKTFAAVHKVTKDQEVYSVTVTEETPWAELRGHFVPAENGLFRWHDGPAVAAWRSGARLVINEVNRCSGDALTGLYAIADDPEFAELTLPTGEKVRPAPGFSIVATMNGLPEDLPEALVDRFPVAILVDEVHPKALEALSEDLRTAAKNSFDARERISTRRWKAFDSLRDNLDKEMAAEAIFGARGEDILAGITIAAEPVPE